MSTKLDVFFTIRGVLSILASLKGILQMTLGPDPGEQLWLSTSAGQTHIIWGQLRAFSFMTDAGQFGAKPGLFCCNGSYCRICRKKQGRRWFFLLVATLGFTGMFLSGTVEPSAFRLQGLHFFHPAQEWDRADLRNGFAGPLYSFSLNFLISGRTIPFIRRMRSAFNPNDPSLQVRLENQKKLSGYLATRPFGGGIGHAGVKAKAFLPDAFLSNIATDSWYVLIWAEQGIVGLALHLLFFLYPDQKLLPDHVQNPRPSTETENGSPSIRYDGCDGSILWKCSIGNNAYQPFDLYFDGVDAQYRNT